MLIGIIYKPFYPCRNEDLHAHFATEDFPIPYIDELQFNTRLAALPYA